jgi:heterodisulfide reductase subunit A-like polyferredoxin
VKRSASRLIAAIPNGRIRIEKHPAKRGRMRTFATGSPEWRSMELIEMDVIVVGAGPAGLTAPALLALAGVSAIV